MYPEKESGHEPQHIETWIRRCVTSHPRASSLQTIGYLKVLEAHEEST